MTKLRHVALLRQIASVRAVKWHPTRTILAVATGSGSVYFWSPNGCLCAQVPADRKYPHATPRHSTPEQTKCLRAGVTQRFLPVMT